MQTWKPPEIMIICILQATTAHSTAGGSVLNRPDSVKPLYIYIYFLLSRKWKQHIILHDKWRPRQKDGSAWFRLLKFNINENWTSWFKGWTGKWVGGNMLGRLCHWLFWVWPWTIKVFWCMPVWEETPIRTFREVGRSRKLSSNSFLNLFSQSRTCSIHCPAILTFGLGPTLSIRIRFGWGYQLPLEMLLPPRKLSLLYHNITWVCLWRGYTPKWLFLWGKGW